MKIATRLLTLIGFATILVGTPACEMQKAEVTVEGYGEKHEAEVTEGKQPDPANPAPPTYFKE